MAASRLVHDVERLSYRLPGWDIAQVPWESDRGPRAWVLWLGYNAAPDFEIHALWLPSLRPAPVAFLYKFAAPDFHWNHILL